MPKKLTHEEFVAAWQASATLAEAAQRARVTGREASLRAAHMRKAGVPLKKFKEVAARLDVGKLTEIAERTQKKK